MRHGAAVDTHKDISAQRALFLWLEIVGSRQAWIDPRRSEIVRQIESDARHRARVRENVHIAERAAQMRIDLHLETQEQRLPETPASLVLEKKGGLVAQLRVPTFRFCIVENFVNELLRLFCKRCGPDHAELQLDLVETIRGAVLPRRFAEHAKRGIKVARIRVFVERRIFQRNVARREDVLPQRIHLAHFRCVGKERQLIGESGRPILWRKHRRCPGDLRAVRVIPVRAIEEVVLEQHGDRAMFLGCRFRGAWGLLVLRRCDIHGREHRRDCGRKHIRTPGSTEYRTHCFPSWLVRESNENSKRRKALFRSAAPSVRTRKALENVLESRRLLLGRHIGCRLRGDWRLSGAGHRGRWRALERNERSRRRAVLRVSHEVFENSCR